MENALQKSVENLWPQDPLHCRTYGQRLANPHLIRQGNYRELAVKANKDSQCLFCPGGSGFQDDQDQAMALGNEVIKIYPNQNRLAQATYYHHPSWEKGVSVREHLVSFPSEHLEGFDQLTPLLLKQWFSLLGEVIAADGSPDKFTLFFSKEGDPNWNAATTIHLHGQTISIVPRGREVVPLIGCCLTSALLEHVAPVFRGEGFSEQVHQVDLLDLTLPLEPVHNNQQQESWRVHEVRDVRFTRRWLLTQADSRVKSLSELAAAEELLLPLFCNLLITLRDSSCPGGVLTISPRSLRGETELIAQYFWLDPDQAAVLCI